MGRKKRNPYFSYTFGARRQSHILRAEVLGVVGVLIGALFTGAIFLDRYISEGRSPFLAAVIAATLAELANADRLERDVGGLTMNPVLTAAAQAKANDMAERGYFAHNAPDGKDPWYWFNQVGYDFLYAGENLAVHFSDSEEVARAWMNSPAHRDNILNPKYTEVGIATAAGVYQGRPTLFVVQMFGTPRAYADPAHITAEAVKALEESPITSQKIPTPLGTANGAVVLGETVQEKATTSIPAAAIAQSLPVLHSEDVPVWAYLISSPKETLRYAYYILGFFILCALLIDIELEIRWHHLRHAMRAGFALVTMSILFIVADWAFFAQPILAAAWRLL